MTVTTPCREALETEIPTSAARLSKAAAEGGWTVRTTFASAEVESKDTTRVIDSILVRLRRWPLAAVGAWHNGKFELAYVWSAFSAPRRIGARELSKFIKETTQ